MSVRSDKGRIAEDVACDYLRSRGWTIVARNFRVRAGELDIVANYGEELAFIEVKSVDAYGPEAAEFLLGKEKRRRIAETAKHFLLRHREYNRMHIRFDVVLIRHSALCAHMERAFEDEL